MANFIKPCEGRVTSPFGNRTHPISHTKKMHWGVDYGNNPSNNSIVASANGAVSYASVMGGYGNVVMIHHKIGGKTYETVYAHLAHISVKKGQSVKQGQLIGVKGTTGNSTGIHLHFEIHIGGRRNSLYTFAKNPLFYVSDPEVEAAQSSLNAAGYKLVVDGIEGERTTAAVKKFQKANKLVADGIAGTKTLAALKKVKVVDQVSKPRDLGNAIVKASTLNLRDKPSVKGKVVGVVKKGQSYKVYGEENGWLDLGNGQWASWQNGKYTDWKK